MKILTEEHVKTARAMPRKGAGILHGERAAKWLRQVKRERKAIAAYYRLLRVHEDHGPGNARIAHRYAQVVTGAGAKWRIKQLTPSTSFAPAWN